MDRLTIACSVNHVGDNTFIRICEKNDRLLDIVHQYTFNKEDPYKRDMSILIKLLSTFRTEEKIYVQIKSDYARNLQDWISAWISDGVIEKDRKYKDQIQQLVALDIKRIIFL